MRVAIVSRIYRPEPSAASLFLGCVADALTSAGHEVDVLTATPPRRFRLAESREKVHVFPVLRDKTGYVRGYLSYLSFDAPLALRMLFMRRPDVIFVEPPPTTGAVVRIISWLRRIPYVYDAADIWSDAAVMATDNRIVLRVLRQVERFAMNGARRLVSLSNGVLTRASELGVRRPGTVTGFGADTHSFFPTAAKRENFFIYAGSYASWHGVEVIIEAFAEFLATHPGFRLRIVGNGTELSVLMRSAAELGIQESVDFHEPVPPAELNLQLNAAVASLATSRPGDLYQYAFATKIYSSFAAGCPVIFAGPGPTGPFLTRAATQVPAGITCAYSASEVAAAMRVLADDPVDAAGRQAVADWAREHHSLAAVARRVATVLEDISVDQSEI